MPVTTETPFRIYSASKAITAMVVHLLENQDNSVESIVDEGLAFVMNGVLTRDRWS